MDGPQIISSGPRGLAWTHGPAQAVYMTWGRCCSGALQVQCQQQVQGVAGGGRPAYLELDGAGCVLAPARLQLPSLGPYFALAPRLQGPSLRASPSHPIRWQHYPGSLVVGWCAGRLLGLAAGSWVVGRALLLPPPPPQRQAVAALPAPTGPTQPGEERRGLTKRPGERGAARCGEWSGEERREASSESRTARYGGTWWLAVRSEVRA